MQKQEGRIRGDRQGEGRRGGSTGITQADERVWEREKKSCMLKDKDYFEKQQ